MNRPRILVADDDFSIRLLVEMALEREGYEVESCGNGADALALFDPARHDLLLLDYRMPQRTGLDVLRLLRADGHRVPAVLASADMTPDLAREAESLGGVRTLAKPFRIENLLAALRDAAASLP